MYTSYMLKQGIFKFCIGYIENVIGRGQLEENTYKIQQPKKINEKLLDSPKVTRKGY